MAKAKSSALRIKATKPVPILLKPVRFDYLKLFKALGVGIKDITTGQWNKVVGDAVDAVAALNIATTPEELAYTLLQRSTTKALFDLVGETNLRNLVNSEATERSFEATVKKLLVTDEIPLTRQFFDRPESLAILPGVQTQLKAWLVAYGLPESSADSISRRLPSHFQRAVTEEWRQNAARYRPVLEVLQSPFALADDRALGWRNYDAHLRQQIEESIFDEPFSLSQIYIPINGYYVEEEKIVQKGSLRESAMEAQHRSLRRVVVSLEKELNGWVSSPNREDPLRVISGGPGSGKSSFARIFAAKVSEEGRTRVLYIQLHQIDPKKDLADEVTRCVRDEGLIAADPFDPENPEPRLLLILDGLDELSSQGRAAAETARAFVREVQRTLDRKNQQSVRLQILLSGRELVVQDNESEFRRSREILTLLPYYVSDEEGRNNELLYIDPSKLLERDLRNDWWQNYGTLTGKTHLTGLPESLRTGGLGEVTSQPLLNYLVALSYTRGKINFDETVNLNLVYGDLVEAVHEGSHNRRRHAAVRGMDLPDFQRVLEEIALAAWHGDGRSTTVREIEEHCQAGNLAPLLKKFQEGAESGVTRLLAAFFFRRHGQRASGDATFVFTHKSFGEYLTACRLVRAVDRVVRQLETRKQSVDDGWNERQALAHWARLCGPAACTTYIMDYIHGEFRRRPEADVDTYRGVLAELFSHVLEHGMPMDRVEVFKDGRPTVGVGTFPEALYQSRNAEESLLVVLNACAVVTRKVTPLRLSERTRTAFGTWFKRIQGQRRGPLPCLAATALSYLGIPGVVLDIADLYGANLAHADLSHVEATMANFGTADLEGANLSAAQLGSAFLERANLEHANLAECTLMDADLNNARLGGAFLREAKLLGASCRGADFHHADLRGVQFSGKLRSDGSEEGFELADFENAIFDGAKLDQRGRRLLRDLAKNASA